MRDLKPDPDFGFSLFIHFTMFFLLLDFTLPQRRFVKAFKEGICSLVPTIPTARLQKHGYATSQHFVH
jgi:hypothetical protein